MAYTSMVINSFIGALLAISGLAKLRRNNLVESVEAYRVLPVFLAARLAIALPFIETALGLALIAGFLMRPVLLVAATVFVAFSLGILINLLRGREIDCGCRSSLRPISWQLFLSDWALAILCVSGALINPPGIFRILIGRSDISMSDGWAALSTLALLALVAKGVELQVELARELQRTPATVEGMS